MGEMADLPDQDVTNADAERISALLRAVEAPAPAGLQRRIAARNQRRQPWWRTAPAIALGVSSAATAACVALVLAITSGGGAAAPTVVRAVTLALARPSQPASANRVAAGTAISFPNWRSRGWPATGSRRDHLDGRTVTTAYYRSYDVGTLGYSIVAGTPIAWGAAGTTTLRGGERYGLLAQNGAHIVTWVEDGHTCVLASRSAPPAELLALAIAQERSRAA